MPELAVIDAYRAGIAANQVREGEETVLLRYQAATKFLRAERLAVEGGEAWTSEGRRFVQGGWAYSALSNLVINDIPQFEDPPAIKCTRFPLNKRQVVCMALEIRAIYRLCGALYMCGGGARSDALGLIDDAHKRCTGMEDWEKTYFQMLGTEILDDCMKPWDEGMNGPPGLAYLSLTEQRRRDEERRQTKESMLTKTMKLKPLRYTWNIHEPRLNNAEWQRLLRSWVQQTTNNCSPHVIDTLDIWDETSKPYVELRADRDIKAGEQVLSERTRSNVTTSIPEDVFEDPNPPPSRRYYCDTCACLMIVPRDCPSTYQTATVPPPPPSPHSPTSTISRSSQASVNAAYGSADDFHSAPSPTIISPPLPPLLLSNLPPDIPQPDLTFHAPTHLRPTCSPTCRTPSLPFSKHLERTLRTSHLTPTRKKQCLVDLLLLRIFTTAVVETTHPLHDRSLLFANCGAGVGVAHQRQRQRQRQYQRQYQEKDKEGGTEWTFTSHVVRPIWILECVLHSVGADSWERLEVCDGWVLSSMMEQIERAMRVSRQPVFGKVFDGAGRLEGVGVANQGEEEKEGDAVWSASLHPVFNMIRVADVGRGERPNVRVVRREGWVCFALGGGIRAGEALVREGDGDGVVGERDEGMEGVTGWGVEEVEHGDEGVEEGDSGAWVDEEGGDEKDSFRRRVEGWDEMETEMQMDVD